MDQDHLTPFREHYEHCRALDVKGQLHECADHLQHPDLLLMEFIESYHLIERRFSPERDLVPGADADDDELVLEPFYESLELHVRGSGDETEKLACLSGAMSPLPEALHPALTHRGLDYVGLRSGAAQHLVLGVAQTSKDETPYVMLLRALNCFAELSPPFRLVELGRELIRGPIGEDVRFDLHIGVTEDRGSEDWAALIELTRDLAEVFKRKAAEHPQFSGTLGSIECVEIEFGAGEDVVVMSRIWRV